ncbi:Alpha/Beta hydrolase fold [Phytophthora cactorum]|nr:Alpha/Beta hydrolase fold [Phytophthora cactorum]
MTLSRYPLVKMLIWSLFLLLAVGFVGVAGKAEVAAVDIDDDARGYFVETHKVVTADDYVLTMYRLPKTYVESQAGAKPAAAKPVVLLQHGLLDSSFTFVNNFVTKAWLLFWWMRGMMFGSLGRYGQHDLPAEIEYALNKTGSSTLSYVGHSEGTTQAFVGFSIDQELAEKVSYFAALAPVAWTGHLTAKIFKGMADVHLDKLFQAFAISEFSAKSTFLQEMIAGFACTVADELCNSAVALVAGPSVSTNTSRIPVYISQTPAGTSVKNMAHYAQNIRDNTFAAYDYGCKCKRDPGIEKCSEKKCENKKVYGSFDPPAYPIEKMVYPRTGFFIGSADTIATATDIERLRDALPSGTIVHELAVKEYSHLDLVWAYNANEKIYQDLLAQLDKYQGVGYTRIPEPIDPGSGVNSASIGSMTDDAIESRTSFSFRQLD